MRSAIALVMTLAVVFAGGCGLFSDPIDDVDCTDNCQNDDVLCGEKPEEGFDYRSYEPRCDAADDVPELCGPWSEGDCDQPDFEVDEATVADIHDALLQEEITCEWLTGEYIRRILHHDLRMEDGNPPMNAFVHLNEQALDTARMLDGYQRCEQELTGPLHCVPFAVKTNYAHTDIPVTNGSLALKDPVPTFDAYTVERLRKAGGVTLGSTAMDEFAAGAQGLSGRSGKTGNAYDTTRSSGGSSAGSGVAPGANMAMAGLGTDNCSSLTVPASYNGLFTLRSSHQLVSTQGIFPSNRLDAVAGPMTRTAEDLALFFDEMATFNPHYHAHCERGVSHEPDYTEALDPNGLEGKRIGILRFVGDEEDDREPFEGAINSAVEEHFEAFFTELENQGAVLVDDVVIDELSLNRRGSGSGYDAHRFLERTEGGAEDFEELCGTGLFSHFLFETEEDCLNRGDQTAGQLESALESGLEHYDENRAYVESVMDDYDIDALVYPADRAGPPRSAYTRTMCVLSSVTGLPTAVVPTGYTDDDLPIGMSFTARMFEDAMLLKMAYAYEQATHHRRAPDRDIAEGPAPLDIAEFNDLHYELGMAAFEQVLDDSDKYDLSAARFAEIAEEVYEDWGVDDIYVQ